MNLLLTFPILSLAVIGLSYGLLRNRLPAAIARHIGDDGAGFSSTPVVIAIMAGIAVIAFGIGAWTHHDFSSLGHWYAGNKAIVICALAAGYGVVVLALATMLSVCAWPGARSGASVGYGLLGFLIGFIISAVILVKVLPPVQSETTGQ